MARDRSLRVDRRSCDLTGRHSRNSASSNCGVARSHIGDTGIYSLSNIPYLQMSVEQYVDGGELFHCLSRFWRTGQFK
jgi:hypothetical protein